MSLLDFKMPAARARAFLDQDQRAFVDQCTVVASDLAGRLRGVSGCFASF